MPAYARRRVLDNIASTLEARTEEFARTLCIEVGKPIKYIGIRVYM